MKSRPHGITPILPTPDVRSTLEWYKRALGATDAWEYGDPVVHAGCSLGSAFLQFSLDPELARAAAGLALFIFVFDLPGYRKYIATLGTPVATELELMPWEAFEFVVIDPNGVRLRFNEFNRAPEPHTSLDVRVEHRPLTPAENKSLMISIDWDQEDSGRDGSYSPRLFTVVALSGNEVVGAASVCGDGVEVFQVRDVMVRREFQGRGIGTRLMHEIVSWIEREVPPGQFVTLLTGAGTTRFYSKFGFHDTDSDLVAMYIRA